MTEERARFNATIALAVLGGGVTGIASLTAALFPFFNGEYLAAGMFVVAAALSFGLLANAVLRQ